MKKMILTNTGYDKMEKDFLYYLYHFSLFSIPSLLIVIPMNVLTFCDCISVTIYFLISMTVVSETLKVSHKDKYPQLVKYYDMITNVILLLFLIYISYFYMHQ